MKLLSALAHPRSLLGCLLAAGMLCPAAVQSQAWTAPGPRSVQMAEPAPDGTAPARLATRDVAVLPTAPVWAPSVRAAALVAPAVHPSLGGTAPLWRAPRQEYDDSPMAGMTGSGFFLGIIGMLAGAAVGSSLAGDCEATCRRDQAAGGAMVGGAILIPLGVHIANPEPGSFLAGTTASALLGAAMWAFVTALPSDPMPLAPFLAAPLQLQGAIFAEGLFR